VHTALREAVENHWLLLAFTDPFDLDQLHRIPLPLDHLPQHGFLIHPMHELERAA
jgi:hypothetical protein